MLVSLPRYALLYILFVAGLALLTYLLDEFLGFTLPNGVSTVVPAMMAALIEGGKIAPRLQRAMTNSEAWWSALAMTAVVAVVSFAVFAALLVVSPQIGSFFSLLSVGLLIGVFFFLLLIVLVINRFFLTMGLNTALRKQG